MASQLHVTRHDGVFARLPLVIGRGPDAGIRLNDRTVSHWHCRIDQIDGKLVVCDLGTVHGTFVNGTRINESPLMPGDILSVAFQLPPLLARTVPSVFLLFASRIVTVAPPGRTIPCTFTV